MRLSTSLLPEAMSGIPLSGAPRGDDRQSCAFGTDHHLFHLDLKADVVSLPIEVLQTWSKEGDYTRSIF